VVVVKKADVEALQEELAEAQDALLNLGEAWLNPSSIAIEWQTFGDVSVGLDAAGNAVHVTFSGNGWEGS
jgi:hypothetical protein